MKNISEIIDKVWKRAVKVTLPTDKETEKWFVESGISEASPSSAIYKFRLWLNERSKA